MKTTFRAALLALMTGAALSSTWLGLEVAASAHCRATTDAPGTVGADGCTGGKPLFWKPACVGYSVSQEASARIDYATASNLVATAFAAWMSAECSGATPSIQFNYVGPTTETKVEYNMESSGKMNTNMIVFRDNGWPHSGDGEGFEEMALTTVTFNANTGEILDGDIELNTAEFNFTTSDTAEYDFQSIVTHEIGHFLGLGHSQDAAATMFRTYDVGTTDTRDLSPDDMVGICSAYLPGGVRVTGDGAVQASPCEPAGPACPSSTTAGCSTAHPCTSGDTGWFVPVAALIAAALRRRPLDSVANAMR